MWVWVGGERYDGNWWGGVNWCVIGGGCWSWRVGLREGKDGFVKLDMSRYIDATSIGLQAKIGALCWGVAEKHTWSGAIFELVGGVRAEPWETEAPKDAELVVVRLSAE